MNKPEVTLRLPAEWEDCFGAVMVAWPHEDTDWAPMLVAVRETYRSLIARLIEAGQRVLVVTPDAAATLDSLHDIDHSAVMVAEVPTNDTWTRDYGPISVEVNGRIVLHDFKFNAWGLKFAADRDNLVNQRLTDNGSLRCDLNNCLDFVLEGGSIESDGRGTLLTTTECLSSPNRNGAMTIPEIEDYLKSTLGVSRVLWLDYGALDGDDTDSHIDTLARFAPCDTILYCGAGDEDTPQAAGLRRMAAQLATLTTPEGRPYNLVELPLPDAIYDEDGNRLPATYVNFLVTSEAVIMPVYGQMRKDYLASQILKIAFPEHRILTVDCRTLIRQHGSLHCATMQISRNILPI